APRHSRVAPRHPPGFGAAWHGRVAPRNPTRSGRPGQAVAPLDIPTGFYTYPRRGVDPLEAEGHTRRRHVDDDPSSELRRSSLPGAAGRAHAGAAAVDTRRPR